MSGLTLDDPGGEIVKVTITSNNNFFYTRYATLKDIQGNTRRYVTDSGENINQPSNQGYKQLAKTMIDL